MNSCAYYQELISSLVDGELSGEENEALMLHLNTCSRCNAMYAVFHDLSDILSEETEPLPEGLHENIMAGVRRSEIMKRSRRMRKVGLRTALTAAACAVLVLFAAVSFDPGRRAGDVSIRSEEEASQLFPAPSPAADLPAADYAFPAAPPQTPAPAPVQTSVTDAGTGAPAYTPVQPEPYNSYAYDAYRQADSLPVWTPAPEPAGIVIPAETPVPETAGIVMPTETPVPETTGIVIPAETPAFFLPRSDAAIPETPAPPAEAAVAAPAGSGETNARAAAIPDPGTQSTEEPVPDVIEEAEEPETFSIFSSMFSLFGAAPEDQLAGSAAVSPANVGSALEDLQTFDSEEPDAVMSGIPLELPAETPKAPAEESVDVYGSEARSKLLAMIGTNVGSLPGEAELTRLVHVTLHPEDSYGSAEKMDIAIYGDFVYCSLYPVTGGCVTYRADCSLKDLDSFLSACAAAPAPSAMPTADPYSAQTPAPAETPAQAPEETPSAA